MALWERVAGHLAATLAKTRAEEGLIDLMGELERSLAGTIRALGATMELRDPYTAGHQRRVAELACAIAARLGRDAQCIATLRMAAPGARHRQDRHSRRHPRQADHPDGRQVRAGQAHPGLAHELLAPVDFGVPLAEMVAQHHERLDGSGYPAGLTDREILPEARILAVADVAEAMISHRPYRPALPVTAAIDELRDGAGRRYDAEACRACVELLGEEGFGLDP